MQLTVLIEFLVPGVATILLVLALLPGGALPEPPCSLPAGDTVTALLLLAIAYPVGILVNVPVFWFQQYVLLPRARQKILERYGCKLQEVVGKVVAKSPGQVSQKTLRDAFEQLHAAAFAGNIDRLNAHRDFHQGIQRLCRGIVIPLLLAMYWVCDSGNPGRCLLVAMLLILLGLSSWLLWYSVGMDERRIAVFYVQLESGQKSPAPGEKDGTTAAKEPSNP